MAYLGVDPGASGAAALVDSQGFTMDWVSFKETPADIWKFIKLYGPAVDLCVVERVGARPGNGASSMFKFGASYGQILGMLVAAEIRFVNHTPTKWQKRLGLIRPKLTRAEKKRVNKAKAQELFKGSPKIIHQNADAFLIAEYARRIDLGVME